MVNERARGSGVDMEDLQGGLPDLEMTTQGAATTRHHSAPLQLCRSSI